MWVSWKDLSFSFHLLFLFFPAKLKTRLGRKRKLMNVENNDEELKQRWPLIKNEQWNEFWSTRGGRKSVRSWSSATKTPSCVKPWRAMSSPAGSSSTPSSHNAITVTGNGSGSTTPRNRLSPAPINIIVNNVTTGVQVGEAANARWRQRTLTSSSAASSQRPATFQTRVTSLGSNPCIF